jgi:hypothetical protein
LNDGTSFLIERKTRPNSPHWWKALQRNRPTPGCATAESVAPERSNSTRSRSF